MAKFFDGETTDPLAEALRTHEPSSISERPENLQQSLLAADLPRTIRTGQQTDLAPRVIPHQSITHGVPWILSLLFMPLHLGWKAAFGVWHTALHILSCLPGYLRFDPAANRIAAGLRGNNGRRMLMPTDAAARFRREFEEEFGVNDLPFYEGGLAQAYDKAKKEVKFLLVVILSPEHDDNEAFVRDTLLAPQVIGFLQDSANDIIIWGGNVLDSEAYQVCVQYKCTKFPFSCLVCLTPKEGGTRMGIVKRLVGQMSFTTYLSQLQATMDKYGSDLAVVRAERKAQEMARNIRHEQDSAYERSLTIDRERARQKKEAAAAAAAREREEREQVEIAALLERQRRQWIAWRATKLLAEPQITDTNIVRIALKMPEESGYGRIVRRFPQDATLEELYAFVECYDYLQDNAQPDMAVKPESYNHQFDFRIASTLPREVYEPSLTTTLGESVGRSGNLIVEDRVNTSDTDDEH